jgi:hypothetical protein
VLPQPVWQGGKQKIPDDQKRLALAESFSYD